jgi:hypothetical protein
MHMHERRPDPGMLDLDLLIARRRADACTPGSPSWDAAMGLVEELENQLRLVDASPHILDSRPVLATTRT